MNTPIRSFNKFTMKAKTNFTNNGGLDNSNENCFDNITCA